LGLAFLAATTIVGVWALWLEPASLSVRRSTVSTGCARWWGRTNAARPDAVCILGDLVTERVLGGHFVEPEAIAVELASSKRRLSVSPRPPGRSGSPASAISGPVDPTWPRRWRQWRMTRRSFWCHIIPTCFLRCRLESPEGRRHLFVATGTGTSLVPVRFRVPPAIAVLTPSSGSSSIEEAEW